MGLREVEWRHILYISLFGNLLLLLFSRLSPFRHCATLWTATCQAPLSMNTRVGCHALLQGIFPTQGSNPGLVHCRQILYH